jgi:branched-chain amino acid transport system permease protein
MKHWRTLLLVAILVAAICLPLYAGTYLQRIAANILIYTTLALSWDMLLRSGQISFGMSGFFGIGSYAAVMTCLALGINPVLSIVLGGLVAALIAALVGVATLHLRGMYFAVVTLAVAMIFQVIVSNLSITGATMGKLLPGAIFGGNSSGTYWLMLGIILLTIAISELFERSRIRFALTSIRNNETLARSTGINIFKYLVFVFVLTSAIQGVVGAASAQINGFVMPEASFSVNYALLPLAMALFGGVMSTAGPVLGGIALGAIDEVLRVQIPYGHLLVYGIVLVVVVLFMPHGILRAAQGGILRIRMQRIRAGANVGKTE